MAFMARRYDDVDDILFPGKPPFKVTDPVLPEKQECKSDDDNICFNAFSQCFCLNKKNMLYAAIAISIGVVIVSIFKFSKKKG